MCGANFEQVLIVGHHRHAFKKMFNNLIHQNPSTRQFNQDNCFRPQTIQTTHLMFMLKQYAKDFQQNLALSNVTSEENQRKSGLSCWCVLCFVIKKNKINGSIVIEACILNFQCLLSTTMLGSVLTLPHLRLQWANFLVAVHPFSDQVQPSLRSESSDLIG